MGLLDYTLQTLRAGPLAQGKQKSLIVLSVEGFVAGAHGRTHRPIRVPLLHDKRPGLSARPPPAGTWMLVATGLCAWLSVCMAVCLFACLCAWLSVCLHVCRLCLHGFVCLCLSGCLSICFSSCLYACLPVSMAVCLSTSNSLSCPV